MNTTAVSFEQTLEAFLASDDFKQAVIASTKASWGGSSYSVELLPDGQHRVLWNNEIGNLYVSPGVILGVPSFDDSGYQEALFGEHPIEEDEFFDLCFGCEGEEIAQAMRDALV